MLPIEAGCKAVVIKGRDTGKDVIVGNPVVGDIITDGCLLDGNNLWEVDPPLSWGGGLLLGYCPEDYLMRIDGGTFETEQESKEKVNEN